MKEGKWNKSETLVIKFRAFTKMSKIRWNGQEDEE